MVGGDEGPAQKGYLCWLLSGKHKQKQNPPCCPSEPPPGLPATAAVFQAKRQLSRGFTPQM